MSERFHPATELLLGCIRVVNLFRLVREGGGDVDPDQLAKARVDLYGATRVWVEEGGPDRGHPSLPGLDGFWASVQGRFSEDRHVH